MLRDVVGKNSHDTLSVAFHGGSDFGFAGFISKNLTNGTCIIILSNLETAPIYRISEEISRMLLGEDVQPPVARQAISVDKSIYSKCAGKYQISADYGITIFEEKHGLSIQWTGLPMRLLLFPASESIYFLRESDKEFTFERNAERGIAGLSFKDREGTITAKKVP